MPIKLPKAGFHHRMNIKHAISQINQMQADGIIEHSRHGLIEAWKRFEKQFPGDTP